MRPDLRDRVSANDRERPLFTGVNGPLMARRSWARPARCGAWFSLPAADTDRGVAVLPVLGPSSCLMTIGRDNIVMVFKSVRDSLSALLLTWTFSMPACYVAQDHPVHIP
jgi:hypothetical protein